MATLSVIVPALNEEGNISDSVKAVVDAIGPNISDYEILVFDDGSTDRTGDIAEDLSRANPNIKVIHNGTNKGFGYNFRRGVELAQMDYIAMVAGDNETPADSTRDLFKMVGQADIVLAYHVTPWHRPLYRRFLSRIYTLSLNILFCMWVKYYNGPNIIRRSLLRRVTMSTNSFAYMSEIMLQLLKGGAGYVETGFKVKPRNYGATKALKISNLAESVFVVLRLWWQIQVCRRKPLNEAF